MTPRRAQQHFEPKPQVHPASRDLAGCGVGALRRQERKPPRTLRKGSWRPYRFVKMRSSSRSPPKWVRSGGASSAGGAAAAALNARPKLRSVHGSVTEGFGSHKWVFSGADVALNGD